MGTGPPGSLLRPPSVFSAAPGVDMLDAVPRLLLAWLALAATGAAEPLRPDVAEYLAVAERYRAGQRAAARRQMQRWPASRISAATAELRRDTDRLRQAAGHPDQIELGAVEAAILMHTELGLLALERVEAQEAKRHLSVAVRLVEWVTGVTRERNRLRREAQLPPGQRLEPRCEPRDLYLGLAKALLASGLVPDAADFASRARRAAPRDAEVLEVSGAIAEALAAEGRVQNRAGKAQDLLADADRDLSAALEIDPGRPEARLRLGHVMLERGRAALAEPLLRDALSQATGARQRYLALLFLGRACQRQGRSDEASAWNRSALETWPDSQAARLALAEALEEPSGLDAARALVAESLDRSGSPDRRADPWWSYLFGDRDDARASLEQLWAHVLAP